ncbi:MAG: SufE family protein [Chloroflexota bacterium]
MTTGASNKIPEPLEELVGQLESLDRTERGQMLIELSDEFHEVSPEVAQRPFPDDHRVQRCESEAYVWATERDDGTLDFHYAVENPQWLSARALSSIMRETLSGQPLEQVAAVPEDIAYRVFGGELSMGKGQGLMGLVAMTTSYARRKLRERGEGA